MKVHVLTAASARLWFEAISDVAPPDGDIRRLEGLLEGGLFRPHMRIVVEHQARPFGRLAARVMEDTIRFWNPDFKDDTAPDRMQEAMRSMIHHMAVARREAGLEHLVIENRPGDDLMHNDLWLRALQQEGYSQTCAYSTYALSLDVGREPNAGAHGLSIQEIDPTREESLLALYRRVKARTLEERDVGLDHPESAIETKKRVGRGRDSAMWLMACVNGKPVGYALANLADEEQGLSAWLVDIGCIPEMRRTGIASALLDEIVRRTRSAGARRLLAAIDDINVPSIRLHVSLGFQSLRDRHYIYQLLP